MKDDIYKDTKAYNARVFNDIYIRLRQLALSVYEWEGLPKTCDARFLEKSLFDYGRAIFVKDPTLGFMNFRCNPSGSLNNYNVPIQYQAYGINYQKAYTYGADDNTLIRNNYEEYPTQETIRLFAYDLYKVKRTIDVNLNAQKTPILILTDERQRQTMVNAYNQYDGFIPLIVGDRNGFVKDSVTSVKTDAPYLLDKLDRHETIIWNKVLSFLGINNTNSDKRERMTDNEVESNNDYIYMSGETMYITRQLAAKEISEKFDLPVTVRRKTFNELFNIQEETEGDDNG